MDEDENPGVPLREEMRLALDAILRRATPHPDDTDADRKRNLAHIEAQARRALNR